MYRLRRLSIPFVLCLIIALGRASYADELPQFVPQVVDDQVEIGYGVALEDVDGDGNRDIILADKSRIVWYRNPSNAEGKWERFVIAENLTAKDNVCLAARDINGDGKVEIAVGAEWNPGDTVNSGAVFYLVAPEDRTKLWTAIRLHHEPVVHRMRWVRNSKDDFVLVVAPLHGRGNQKGEGEGVRLLAYTVPESRNDATSEWKTEVLDDTMHITHNLDIGQWVGDDDSPEEILYLGKEGAKQIQFTDGKWTSDFISGIAGGGEIRMSNHSGENILATIEPFHGSRLVHYVPGDASAEPQVIDEELKQGHAIAMAELVTGNATSEIVYGWRQKNAEGVFGVRMAYRDGDGKWKRSWIDQNGMACEDLRIADLDGDGRPDVVASGRSTKNLKIYWNRE